jgi:glycosyltransferase involved in cell wall biosynthesis
MKVCYWGTYDADYARNKILISGLKANGIEIIECNAKVWRNTAEKIAAASSSWFNIKVMIKWFYAYATLIIKFLKIKGINYVFVGYSGHFDVFLAYILCRLRRVPLIFDAFLSLYDSLVFDRKTVKKHSFKAKILYNVDKYSCKLSNIVLLDTNRHIEYFISQFCLPKEKFQRVLIGADDTVFFPQENNKPANQFTVLHFGKYIPLHGMEYIIRAAKELEDANVFFRLIGSGDEYKKTSRLARKLKIKNVQFIKFLPQYELREYIHSASICLGVFGDTEKAKRVVPNKIYEAMAMKKPVITGDSSAAREILKHKVNCFLCEMENPQAIAGAILHLKNDAKLRERIAEEGYKTYRNCCSPLVLGRELSQIILKN